MLKVFFQTYDFLGFNFAFNNINNDCTYNNIFIVRAFGVKN